MKEELRDLFNKEGISDPDNPTESDIKKILNLGNSFMNNKEMDMKLVQQYYTYLTNVIPSILNTVNELASKSLGKEAIHSFNKRIESLNKRYEVEKDPEILQTIREEISEIFDRIEKESDKQRDFIIKLVYGVMGTAAIIGGVAIGVKNRELGKKIIEGGLKVIR